MCQTAAILTDEVLPEVALRQWVFTLPFELRARVAYDGKTLGAVTRIFVDTVLGFYAKRMKKAATVDGKSGAIAVIQRVSSDMRLNPHLHVLLLDGVYTQGADGPVFHGVGHLSTTEVADVLEVARVRIVRHLMRRGVLTGEGHVEPSEELTEREPALAQLAYASVSGLMPAGPELRRKLAPLKLMERPGVAITAPLSVHDRGFSLHAATRAGGADKAGREALIRYVLRPPLAQERVSQTPEGLVRIALKKAFLDGTVAIDLDPLSLLSRLCGAVPPPRQHQVRYAGVLASASKDRQHIMPKRKAAECGEVAEGKGDRRFRYMKWAELLKRTFAIELLCPRCKEPMKLVALVTEPESVKRFLRGLGEPTEAPPRAPARGPPWFRAVRRTQGTPNRQQEMFA